jgi:molecular chaperone GrpE
VTAKDHKKDKAESSTAAFQQVLGAKEDSSEPLLDHASYAELQQQLTNAEEKASQNWERVLRMQAEMDNMHRRVERDIASAHKFALEKFVLELLPVIDSLERAITTHLNDAAGADSLLDGVKLTLRMFNSALEKFGVEQVDPTGKIFNPELHQAVSTQEDSNFSPNMIINVLQKGYLLNNRLIRPALVVVAK